MNDHKTITEAEPKVANLDDLWAWMNTWGDVNRHDYPHQSGERIGYERAIEDMLIRFREMGMTNCSNESWRKFTGRH